MKPLFQEYYNLNVQYQELNGKILKNPLYATELDNYNKIIIYLQNTINDKISHTKINQSKFKRNKRGLFDGLGTIIKTLTGNLDSEDGKKYDKILDDMFENQQNLENQLKLQYTLNQNLIQNFNKTMQDIQHNDIILKSRIMQLQTLVQGNFQQQDILYAKDIYNQLALLYNTILNVLQDVENSITFCKLKTMHPSIIKTKDLYSELQKIAMFYKNQLPFDLIYENILDFETILDVYCKIENDQIIYFLSLPIDFEQKYELYYLQSIPTRHEFEFVTIIPNFKYLLKSRDNQIIPLSDICKHSRVYQCSNFLQVHNKATCEKQVLLHENSSHCTYTKLEIEENYIEYIPEINQHLAILKNLEKLKIKCQEATEAKSLKGIYLIKNNDCKIFIHDNEIHYNDKTIGRPQFIRKINFDFNENKISNFSIKLKSLKLGDITSNHVTPIKGIKTSDLHIPSIWTILLYIILLCTCCCLIIFKFKNKRVQHPTADDKGHIQLPEQASFAPVASSWAGGITSPHKC